MELSLLEKPPFAQQLKNFPIFYGTRGFITMFTRALHWSLPWGRSIQSIPPYPISLRPILILSTHLRLGLPSGLLWLSPISYMHPSLPLSCYMPCPSHSLWLDHSNYIWRRIQVMKLLSMQFSPTSCHFIPYSQTPSVCVHPLMWETKFHTHTNPRAKL
jgi:hypothetical protein